MAAVRSLPGFGGTVKAITPEPVPLAGGVNEIQLPPSIVAVHAQSASVVVTVTVAVAPLVAIVCVAGASV
jgi:hypothetical protein